MKRKLALLVVIVLCVALFAGCGAKKVDLENPDAPDDSAEIKGETYDTGLINALVPEGWMAFPVEDVFAEEEGAIKADRLQICKDAETQFDIFSKPYIDFTYYDAETDMIPVSSEWYDDTEELASYTTGDITWTGFTGASGDQKLAVLNTGEAGSAQYQAVIWLESSDGSVTLEDADVQAILASICESK